MTDTRLVVTTAGSADEARRIAEALLDRKLAACVNILPRVASIFRWKGKTEESFKAQLLLPEEISKPMLEICAGFRSGASPGTNARTTR